jgi:hypothetical protein
MIHEECLCGMGEPHETDPGHYGRWIEHVDTARSAALMPGEDCPAPCAACDTLGDFPDGDT